jgi:SET family sugar efflux transporter-like MFS transporter
VFPALLIGVLLIGLGDSMAQPYLVLFGVDRVGLSPLQVGLLISVTAISGVAFSTWLARRYDRRPSRWPLLVAILGPAIGYPLLTATTSYALLLVVAATLLATGAANFPQLFALARDHLGGSGRGTPALRSMWSLAWAIGPLVGAVLLGWQGYRSLFFASTIALVAVVVPALVLGRTPAPQHHSTEAAGNGRVSRRLLALPAGAFVLFHTSMFAGSVVLPLFVTQTLHRPSSDVGLLFSVCAFVEIPASLALIALPDRIDKVKLILMGMSMMVLYFALSAASTNLGMLIGAQVARAIAIAVPVALGINHFQELMPGAAGRATTLFTNTATVGSLIAGIIGGSAAQFFGNQAALVICGALAAIAVAGMALGERLRRQSPVTASSASPAEPARQP